MAPFISSSSGGVLCGGGCFGFGRRGDFELCDGVSLIVLPYEHRLIPVALLNSSHGNGEAVCVVAESWEVETALGDEASGLALEIGVVGVVKSVGAVMMEGEGCSVCDEM